MARVFRHTYTKNGVRKPTKNWYIEYRDADGRKRRVPGYTDKAATLQKAAQLEREAERVKAGLIDRHAEDRKRPLTDHISEWKSSLLANGCTADYARKAASRLERTVTECGFIHWQDISASRVEACLAKFRHEENISIQTSNYYLRACKQFCHWMEMDGRAPHNPLKHLRGGNARTDRRHDRRAFTDDELQRLIDTTHGGPTRRHVPGTVRAMTYRLSAETGLRANEIRSLTVGSFRLEANPPTVTVGAAYSKHRREDVLPIRPRLATDLAEHFKGMEPTGSAFKMPKCRSDVVRVLRKDLEDAGIEYRNGAGRVLDFHAFRHTFITNLVRGGVHPRVAQSLARHSTITLTMDRYSHTVLGDLSAALEVLPDSSVTPPTETSQPATENPEAA